MKIHVMINGRLLPERGIKARFCTVCAPPMQIKEPLPEPLRVRLRPNNVLNTRYFRDQVRITLGVRPACDPEASGTCGPIPQ